MIPERSPERRIDAAALDSRLLTRPGEAMNQDQLTCDICGARMTERQCKILCTNCGYTRDCSDP
jgi:uncharacterized Zn finger protein (UPF0148 family)